MISRRKEIFLFVALCVVFSALFTVGCSDNLLHPAQDGACVLVQLENGGERNATTSTGKWQGSAWIENRDGSTSHRQDISSTTDELSITFENVVIGSEIKIYLDVTSSGDVARRYLGSSSWKKIIDGVNVIVIVLKEVVIVDAATPTIATQPEGETKTFAAGQATAVTKELTVEASVSDGGVLSYQWYSNTSSSPSNGTAIEGATSSSYKATVNAKETKYFYCVVTNTNNKATGSKTAAVTSHVATLASIEGELTSIAATYKGSYMLVGAAPNYSDFTVTETYTSGAERVSVDVTPNENSYTIGATNGNSAEAIGQVSYTVTRNTNSQITANFTIPVKYELDASNLTITGDSSVEQNGDLVLTAQYKGDDGNDVQYKLYDESGSSDSYKVIEKVSISWTGATQQDNAWEALAETNNAGPQTATVKLSTGDAWCVTSDGIEKSHPYEVTAATSGDSSGISDENSLIEAINQTQEGGVVTITQEITVTNTITINKNVVIEGNYSGKLLRSNKDTVTGPMFDISSSGNLTLQNITLDGQYDDNFYGGENNPFVVNQGGTLIISSSTLTNNRMSPTGTYGSIDQLYASAAVYSAGTTTIKDSTISEVSSNNTARGIVYGVSGSLTISNTNITLPSTYSGNALYLESAVSYNINTKTSGLSQSYKSVTPDSP